MSKFITSAKFETVNEKITSLELVKQINIFREKEGNRKELRHADLLKVIRDEFEDEIREGNISESVEIRKLPQGGSAKYPYFELTLNQAKQVLVRESKFVRKAIIAYIDELGKEVKRNLPKTFSEALYLAAKQAEQIEQQQKQIEEQKPKVLFADSVSASKTTILIGELATIIKQNGYDIGQNRLFSWMRDNGYLIKRNGADFNMPTQKSMDLELFKVKETTITHSDGHVSINKTVKVTGKGQLYFVNKFLNK